MGLHNERAFVIVEPEQMCAAVYSFHSTRRPRPPRRIQAVVRRLLIGALVVSALAFGLATAAHGSAPAASDQVTVEVGDTIWSLAVDRYPAADTRAKVDEIVRMNKLRSPQLYPGEVLRLPAS